MSAPDLPLVLVSNFDSAEPGPVTAAEFRARVSDTCNSHDGAYEGMTFRQGYRRENPDASVVRTELSAGKYVNSAPPGRGNVLPFRLPASYEAIDCTYDVRFAAPVDFAAGGKLPGPVGVAPGHGPGEPEGGGSVAHGFSARLMWHGARMWKAVRDSGRSNLVETYLYHPGQVREFGDDVYWQNVGYTNTDQAFFVPGVWHTVEQHIVLNTVGEADGVLQTWFDGRPMLDQDNIVYRTDPAVKITHFDWSIFRGGDAAWVSPETDYVDITDLEIRAA